MDGGADSRTLDELVGEFATQLMTVGASSLAGTGELLLERLLDRLHADLGFVRRNDHELGASILVAEWPRRVDVPDPDPLGVVPFAGADPVFASLENFSEVAIARPDAADTGYQDRVREGSGIPAVSAVMVPMRRDGVTTGVLGVVNYGDREWSAWEIGSLKSLASLLGQTLSRVQAEARLRYLAYHDELTDLPNRRALLDHLQPRLDADTGDPVGILVIDVDRLKAMNDFLGHAVGDQFLTVLAHRLREHAGPDDVLARLAGDAFVVVLGARSAVDLAAADLARTLQRALAAPIRFGDTEMWRTVSIGVAVRRAAGGSASDLLAEADQALLAAKASGGHRTVVVTDQMRADHRERTDVELHLREAIARGELMLHFQPQVDLVTGELLGAEALVRWRHPLRGLLPPDSFVQVAELTDLSGELGRWVLRTACSQLGAWQAEFDVPDFRIGVNVTPAQLIMPDLVADVVEALRTHRVAAGNLVLEILETTVVADLGLARESLADLRGLGVHLAIDDFGTGYSTFAQLKELPADTLKLDRGFVTDVAHNGHDQAIVRAVVALAREFGLETMAEGVETAEAAATLVEIGCHQAQGYLISRPVPAGDMTPFLRAEQARRAT